jgi:hypothetical protein
LPLVLPPACAAGIASSAFVIGSSLRGIGDRASGAERFFNVTMDLTKAMTLPLLATASILRIHGVLRVGACRATREVCACRYICRLVTGQSHDRVELRFWASVWFSVRESATRGVKPPRYT